MASSLEVGKAKAPAAARDVRATVVARTASGRTSVERAPGSGTGPQPGLVILVSFANQPSLGTTEDQWAADFFAPTGSVAGYYTQNSFGKFALTPAPESGGVANNGVVGWLQLPYNHPNFQDNFSDPNETKLGVDAVAAADPYVDYKSFDKDGNGVLSTSELHITIIVAGYETSYGGSFDTCGNSVWGHQGGLYDSAPKLDGTVVNRDGGTMFGEFMCASYDTPGHMSTQGIMAHELGHDLGFPDLYDTDYSSAGISRWSLMSGGSWNRVGTANAGTTPAGLDAFSKSYQGWITPSPIVGAVNGAPLPAAANSPTAYRLLDNPDGRRLEVRGPQGQGEYYLVENRQLVGYDAGLPACGVIVYHVDEGVTSTNDANANDTHRLLDVVEADGSKNMDTYPYLGGPRGRVPGSERPRRLQRRDRAVRGAVLGQPVGHRRARQRRLRGPDDRELLRAAEERRVRLGHGPRRRRPAASPPATTAPPRRPASPPSRATAAARRCGGSSARRPPARSGCPPPARRSTPCWVSTAAASVAGLKDVGSNDNASATDLSSTRGGQGQARRDLPDRRRRR